MSDEIRGSCPQADDAMASIAWFASQFVAQPETFPIFVSFVDSFSDGRDISGWTLPGVQSLAQLWENECLRRARRRVMSEAISRGSCPPTGPFATDRQAADAARLIGGPLREGWSILSAKQNEQLLVQACESAGITLGAYDQRILTWLSGFEDSTCAVIAGLITRAGGRSSV